MSIICKRKHVDLNTFETSLFNIYSSSINTNNNETLHIICVTLSNNLDIDLEIIGDNVYIQKNIKKKNIINNNLISFFVDDIETIYTFKFIINNDVNKNKIIYMGDYKFNIIKPIINDKINITLTITKIIKDIDEDDEHQDGDDEHQDEDEEREHEDDEHQDEEREQEDSEQEDSEQEESEQEDSDHIEADDE
jgi:hypothetical protein